MAILGYRDTQSLVLPAGWDATALKKWENEAGLTYEQIAGEMNVALAALAAEMAGHPLWTSLLSFTDRPEVRYASGASGAAIRFTEYSRTDPEFMGHTGHMLPLVPWHKMLGWTWSVLRKMEIGDARDDVRNAIDAMRQAYRLAILNRILKRGDDSGVNNGLGTAGYSPGFATAAASTNVDFTPPTYRGNSFDSNHEHYNTGTGGFTIDVFRDAKADLMEHGHMPPYDYIIGLSDEQTVKAISGFIPVGQQLVNYGSLQDTAAPVRELVTDDGIRYIGTVEDFAVRVVPGIPQYYGFAWKGYGARAPKNPLRVRLEKGQSSPQVIAMTDPNAGSGISPLQHLMVYSEFGVGIGEDRTNGVVNYTNNATWADGTAS